LDSDEEVKEDDFPKQVEKLDLQEFYFPPVSKEEKEIIFEKSTPKLVEKIVEIPKVKETLKKEKVIKLEK